MTKGEIFTLLGQGNCFLGSDTDNNFLVNLCLLNCFSVLSCFCCLVSKSIAIHKECYGERTRGQATCARDPLFANHIIPYVKVIK
jgi:hypothetical protein